MSTVVMESGTLTPRQVRITAGTPSTGTADRIFFSFPCQHDAEHGEHVFGLDAIDLKAVLRAELGLIDPVDAALSAIDWDAEIASLNAGSRPYGAP